MRASVWVFLALALTACGPSVPRPAPPAPTIPSVPPAPDSDEPKTPPQTVPPPTEPVRTTDPEPEPAAQRPPITRPATPPGLPPRAVAASPRLAKVLVETIEGPALELHMVDIGQGDGMVLKTPGGRYVIIDSGPDGGVPHLMRYLEGLGVESIALAIATHPHADHIAGTPAIMERYPVKLALDSGFVYASPHYKALLLAIRKGKVPLSLARSSKLAQDCHVDRKPARMCRTVTVEDGVTFEVLAPDDPLLTGTRSDANSNSIVLRLDYRGMVFLFTGDAEEETEARVLQDPKRLAADVLKVAHHGSRYASQSEFLRAANPRLALISAGARNRYGHPTPEAIRRIEGVGATVLSTSDRGHIQVRTDGQKLAVEVKPRGAKQAINLKSGPLPPRVDRRAEQHARLAANPIDINTASLEELVKLPGIGKVTAARILEFREQSGPFARVEDLVRVKGIGKKTMEKVRAFVVVSPRS